MEARYGSLFAALRARRRAPGKPAGPAGTLTSFRGGMQELTDALASALGDQLRLRTRVTGISDLGDRGFRVHLRDGPPIEADGVVLACPPGEASGLVAAIDPDLSSAFESIPSAPLAVVHLAYRRAAVGRQPEGFGFLVPRGAGPRILGALWPSQIFDGRAPDDVLTTTAMVGGACDPHAPGLSDTELTAIVRKDLRTILDILPAPYLVRVVRHSRGIPQYTLGHAERVETVERRLGAFPGLWAAGNALHGVSINACVEDALRVAGEVNEHLDQTSGAAAP